MSKTLILMRGLPSCGKTHTAKTLAGDIGVIYSTDEYFYTMRKPEEPEVYSFNPNYLGDAHNWNQQRTFRSIETGHPLIIVDNTNVVMNEVTVYSNYAFAQDYEVQIAEPTSDWWLAIRELLLDKRGNQEALKEWSLKLAKMQEGVHGVPAWTIERRMRFWEDFTVEQLRAAFDNKTLSYGQTL